MSNLVLIYQMNGGHLKVQAEMFFREIVEVLETNGLIVSSSVSVLQPVSEVNVPDDVYVNPSTSQVYELQALATVVLLMIGMIDKSSVITESQPKTVPFGMLKVALLLLDDACLHAQVAVGDRL